MTRIDDDPWADLADLITTVARELQTHRFPADVIELVGSEQMVIRYVHRNPGSSAGDVARGTGLQRSNLSAALKTLEARGLVERRPDPADARRIQLVHTEAADANLARLRAGRSAVLVEALRTIGETPDGAGAPDTAEALAAVQLLGRIEAGLTAGRSATASPPPTPEGPSPTPAPVA